VVVVTLCAAIVAASPLEQAKFSLPLPTWKELKLWPANVRFN
jgi:hypothetical protein